MTIKQLKKEIKDLEALTDSLWKKSDRLKAEIKKDPSTREEKTVEILNNHAHIRGVYTQIKYHEQDLKAQLEAQ